MLRLIFQLLGLLALLMATLPAAARWPAPASAVASDAEHCSETKAAADQHEDGAGDEEQHPCCKSSMSCCPVAAPLAGPASPPLRTGTLPAHRPAASTYLPGAADPPLTEPPTFA